MNSKPPAVYDLSQMPRPPVGTIAFIGAILLGLMVMWSSFYTVAAESEGVVLRFGKYLKTVEPGLHFKLPLGMDRVTVLPTRRQLKLEFGFFTRGYSDPVQASDTQAEEKSMVTGDLNAAMVEWVVQYRIADARQYLFEVRNPAQTLRDLSNLPCGR
jgi:membrane protease subunit HflK